MRRRVRPAQRTGAAASTFLAVVCAFSAAIILTAMSVHAALPPRSGTWERDVAAGLERFGHFALHPWQHRVLCAWRDGRDCLVLSGTGRCCHAAPAAPKLSRVHSMRSVPSPGTAPGTPLVRLETSPTKVLRDQWGPSDGWGLVACWQRQEFMLPASSTAGQRNGGGHLAANIADARPACPDARDWDPIVLSRIGAD